MIECHEIQEVVRNVSLVRACDVVKSGAVRLMTPFQYPDGSNVDVFVKTPPLLARAGIVELSDYGQTIAWLRDLQIKPTATKKRKQQIDDVCETLGLVFDGWQLSIRDVPLGEIGEALMRLSQGCIRVADLMFTQRLQATSTLRDDVEEFFADLELPYEPDFQLEGNKGNLVTVDFKVEGTRQASLVQLLSSGSHVSAVEVFRTWYDLANPHSPYQFVTIVDDRQGLSLKEDDQARIQDFSLVLPWNDRTSVRQVLGAA